VRGGRENLEGGSGKVAAVMCFELRAIHCNPVDTMVKEIKVNDYFFAENFIR